MDPPYALLILLAYSPETPAHVMKKPWHSAMPRQMYAGSKYPASDVERLRPGLALVHARNLEASMMDAGAGDGDQKQAGQLRRVYPFTMSPETAMERAVEWIRWGAAAGVALQRCFAVLQKGSCSRAVAGTIGGEGSGEGGDEIELHVIFRH